LALPWEQYLYPWDKKFTTSTKGYVPSYSKYAYNFNLISIALQKMILNVLHINTVYHLALPSGQCLYPEDQGIFMKSHVFI
jgi:hypothetical protein